MAVKINLIDWCIYVYDPQVVYVKEDKLQFYLEPLAILFPHGLRIHGHHTKLGDKLHMPFKIVRKDELNFKIVRKDELNSNLDGYVYLFTLLTLSWFIYIVFMYWFLY